AELARLVDREVLLVRVDDPHGGGDLRHVADAAERAGELVLLATQDEQLLLGQTGAGDVVEVDLLELLEALETLVHRGEVREHAAEPAVVHVGHPDARGLLGHGLLGLLLGADEEDGAAVRDGLLDELVRAVDVRQRLLEVDDVDAVALGEDEALHLRVPTAGLVPEVDTALEELAHGHDGHDTSFHRAARDPPGARTLLAAPPQGRAAVRLSVTTLVVAPLAPPVPTPAAHPRGVERSGPTPDAAPLRTGRTGKGART